MGLKNNFFYNILVEVMLFLQTFDKDFLNALSKRIIPSELYSLF
jgi:hypothetical protein